MFDMTNDGIPELHVLTDISYSVHTVEGKKLITWYEGDRNRRPLNNKAILGKQNQVKQIMKYIVLDNKGEEVFLVPLLRIKEIFVYFPMVRTILSYQSENGRN